MIIRSYKPSSERLGERPAVFQKISALLEAEAPHILCECEVSPLPPPTEAMRTPKLSFVHTAILFMGEMDNVFSSQISDITSVKMAMATVVVLVGEQNFFISLSEVLSGHRSISI